MKIEVPSLLCWLILIQSHTTLVQGLIVSGELNTANLFHYVTSFCFANEKLVHGQAHVEAEIHIPHGASYGITFFYHSDWDTNVAEAIHDWENKRNCLQRIAAVYPHRNNHFETKESEVKFINTIEQVANGTATKTKTINAVWKPDINVSVNRFGWFSVVISNCNYNKYELDNGCFNNPCNNDRYKRDTHYKKVQLCNRSNQV